MTRHRGDVLRAPTLHLRGEYQRASSPLGGFLICYMIQRISVRSIVTSDHKTLLLRRADGRESILGKYELPGGRVYETEQPEDALKRYLNDDTSLSIDNSYLRLIDVMTYRDTDDRNIQYAVIIYEIGIDMAKQRIKLSDHYSKYRWYQAEKTQSAEMTDLTKLILGMNGDRILSTVVEKESSPKKPLHDVVIYSDGGSRGNPGPSAAGYVIVDKQGAVIDQGGEYLGITTNNQAEYQGVRAGLEAALRHNMQRVECRIDSMLVVNQLNNLYKIKNRELWPINERVKELVAQFERVTFRHVPREMNRLADGMVNKTLDAEKRQQIPYNEGIAR